MSEYYCGFTQGKREQLRAILARLRNPDEAMVEAVMSTHCGRQLDDTLRAFVFRCFCRALADHLAKQGGSDAE